MYRSCFISVLVVQSLITLAQRPSAEGVASVTTDRSGVTIETQVIIEQEGDNAKITFWQETENGFIFRKVNWTQGVVLKLDNGQAVRLSQIHANGQILQKGGYSEGYFVPDLYQRYTSFLLSPSDCKKLKEHNIVQVSYQLNDNFDHKIHHVPIDDSEEIVRSQLVAFEK